MKFDLNHHDRAYDCMLFLGRAADLRKLAAKRTLSSNRQELEDEAAYLEMRASKYATGDNGYDADPSTLITPNPRIDLDTLDDTGKGVTMKS